MLFCFIVDTNGLGLTLPMGSVVLSERKETYKYTTDRIFPFGKLPVRAVTMRSTMF